MSKSEIQNWTWAVAILNSLRSLIQRYVRGTSSDNEWINLLRFWVHLLLLFAVASAMRNYLFILKIFIPTPYCWQKRTLIEMTTRFHSLSPIVTCYLSLSIFVPLIVIKCHSLYHSLSFAVTLYITRLSFYQQS